MRIGVVSDTHNNYANVSRIVELFNDVKVEHVVHTGDITRAKTLELFSQLNAPLSGVFGNNDQEKAELDQVAKLYSFNFAEPSLRLVLGDRRILIVHDPKDLEDGFADTADVVLHGHTHLLRIDYEASCLIFNPGECAGHMEGLNAIGVVDLESMTPTLLKF